MIKDRYIKPDTVEQVKFLLCSLLADSNDEGIEDISVTDPIIF